MKIQFTGKDIEMMSEQVVRHILREYYDVDKIHIYTVLFYNPLTQKYAFYYKPYSTDWKKSLAKEKEAAVKKADKLGDGPIFEINYQEEARDTSDDSFGYDIGMESGTHHVYTDYPTSVSVSSADYLLTLAQGQISPEDDETELSEDDMSFVEKIANDNIDILQHS